MSTTFCDAIDFISWESIKEIAPKAANLVAIHLNANNVSMTHWIETLYDEVPIGGKHAHRRRRPAKLQQLLDLFDLLQKEFEANTTVGCSHLSLDPSHAGDVNGDGAELIDAKSFFIAIGMRELTPAGKKFEDKVIPIIYAEY